MQILVIKRMEKPRFDFFQDLLIMIVLEPNSQQAAKRPSTSAKKADKELSKQVRMSLLRTVHNNSQLQRKQSDKNRCSNAKDSRTQIRSAVFP